MSFLKVSNLHFPVSAIFLLAVAYSAHADTKAAAPLANASPESVWNVTYGAGVTSAPRYAGADTQKVRVVPVIGATYGRYFFGAAGGNTSLLGAGAYLYKDSHWQLGAALSYDIVSLRKESDDTDRLRGLGDIARTAHVTLFANYKYDWFNARSRVSTDIGGKSQGTIATLDVEGRYVPVERLTLSAGPGLTWGSAQYNQTFYGVNASQSSASGLREYSPKAGATVRVSAGANYQLTPAWDIGARVIASKLPSNIGDSPLVANKVQTQYGVSGRYRF